MYRSFLSVGSALLSTSGSLAIVGIISLMSFSVISRFSGDRA
jgi:hypothetical protein